VDGYPKGAEGGVADTAWPKLHVYAWLSEFCDSAPDDLDGRGGRGECKGERWPIGLGHHSHLGKREWFVPRSGRQAMIDLSHHVGTGVRGRLHPRHLAAEG
jgi:hypothetical protein